MNESNFGPPHSKPVIGCTACSQNYNGDPERWQGCASTMPAPLQDPVTIRWSETRWYAAVIPRSRLAEAIAAKGPEDDGHELPANLHELAGDPFGHGDLNGLLCELEEECTMTEVDDIEVSSVEEVPS